MSVANWIALVVPVLGLIGGAVVYTVQKAVDRKNQILLERRALYRQFISQVQNLRMKVLNNRWDEFDDWYFRYKQLLAEIFVTAPDPVVKAIIALDHEVTLITGSPEHEGLSEDLELFKQMSSKYFALVLQMRKDTFGSTKVAVDEFAPVVAAIKDNSPMETRQ